MLLFVRSLIFNIAFYVQLVLWLIVILPVLAFPPRATLAYAKAWARCNIWLMRAICGIHVDVRGVEKIPKGPLIVASKHQSLFETFALMPYLDQPLYIVKRELLNIPSFGWALRRAGMIGVDRDAGGRALIKMSRAAGETIRNGRQLIIFPEGTRRPVGAPPDYKPGIAQIYAESGVPCLPVALNSGVFWPRRKFLRYPGTLTVEFLDPIPPGLDKRQLIAEVAAVIESATNRMIQDASAG